MARATELAQTLGLDADPRVLDVARAAAMDGCFLQSTPDGIELRKIDPREKAVAEVRGRLSRMRTTPDVKAEAERWCRDALAQGWSVEEAVSAAMSAAVALDAGHEMPEGVSHG